MKKFSKTRHFIPVIIIPSEVDSLKLCFPNQLLYTVLLSNTQIRTVTSLATLYLDTISLHATELSIISTQKSKGISTLRLLTSFKLHQ